MGKKKQEKNKPTTASQNVTLREEKIGKKHADVASILRIKHLTRVATWASGEGQVKPLGSMLGQRLSATAEASGLPLDSSVLLCQKCETILRPGFNCTIRIKKNIKNIKQYQNTVVYTCHFCRHDNLKWGSIKGAFQNSFDSKRGLPVPTKKESESVKIPITPLSKMASNLLQNEKNDFNSISVSASASASASVASGNLRKRQRKGWMSLKEKTSADVAQNSKRVNNFAIPFKI